MSDRDLHDNLTESNNPASAGTTYNAQESEKAVLALCMRSREALENSVMKRMVAGDFVDARHALIFEAISALYVAGEPVSRHTVCEKLRSSGNIDKAGGDQGVYDIANYNCVRTALDSYIDVVLSNSQARKLITTLDDLLKTAKKRESSVNDVVDLGVGKLNELKVKDDSTGFEPLSVILKRNLNELRDATDGKIVNRAVKTGFSYLDNITGGFKPGTVNIIAARPGMGKTALVLNIATNVATMYNKRVAIFSLEMSKSEIANRILAAKSTVNYKKIIRGEINKEELIELGEVMGDIASLPIYIDEKTNTNPTDIMTKCQELMAEQPVSLVIIDYLQLLTTAVRNSGSRQNEIAEISRSLKVLAKELEVPVIALSQLNRGTENGDDDEHIPTLANIRDSGAIEQDADCVIFIHRPSYYTKKKEASEKQKIEDAQLIVAKNRHGETDTAYVKWYGAKTLFFELDRNGDPVDPRGSGSAYTRTTSADRSSGDYHFDDAQDDSVPMPEDAPFPDEPTPVEDDEPMDMSENEAFFSDDMHDDLPGGY